MINGRTSTSQRAEKMCNYYNKRGAAIYIDTLRTYDRLHNAGMPAGQAHVYVEILYEFFTCKQVERKQRAAAALRAEADMRAAADDRAHTADIARMKTATARSQ